MGREGLGSMVHPDELMGDRAHSPDPSHNGGKWWREMASKEEVGIRGSWGMKATTGTIACRQLQQWPTQPAWRLQGRTVAKVKG